MKEKSISFHTSPTPGKIGSCLTKKISTLEDLSLAYSPGVSFPCLEIEKDESLAYKYTNKANTVAIISNGSATLGLGSLKPIASKPVMEGKAALMKIFGGIDSFDIEVDEQDPYKLAEIVSKISHGFGGINLEDIKAPDCFIVEKIAREKCNIPVFHDDQNGTAVVTIAGLINSMILANKEPNKSKILVLGAGAAGIAFVNLFKEFYPKCTIVVADSKGPITKNRANLNEYKAMHASDFDYKSTDEAAKDCDVIIGLSGPKSISKNMISVMNQNMPIVFALSNPTPEISRSDVLDINPKAIYASGLSNTPNQINNVLCFPFLFRALLDTKSKKITNDVLITASKKIAEIARTEKGDPSKPKFGPNYIIPNIFNELLKTELVDSIKNKIVNGS